MSEISFETALDSRVDEMLDACTRCGKCVEVCPSVAPAGITDASAATTPASPGSDPTLVGPTLIGSTFPRGLVIQVATGPTSDTVSG